MEERLGLLKRTSEHKAWLQRTLFSASAETAANHLRRWMKATGMEVHYDALTNVYGLAQTSPDGPDAPRIHIGSHYDTVINAGAYDGTLGVLLGIAVVEVIREARLPLRHNLSALAFCDEEGVRFQTTFLGSAYLCGRFDQSWLDKPDEFGKTLGEWLVDRAESIDAVLQNEPYIRPSDCFLEAHIEQGPVLEAADKALGVFTEIAAQTRAEVEVIGRAGHAGTTPGSLRCDPLPVACRMVQAIDALCQSEEAVRATVGRLEVSPNASNVIPGKVRFTIDLRYPDAAGLRARRDRLQTELQRIADGSKVEYRYREAHWADDAILSPAITDALAEACECVQGEALRICSGAGHDSMMVARVCPTSMLAVRCREGLSHHPDEFVSEADCRLALKALVDAVIRLDRGA
jgi:allantoate deiminase